MRGVTVQTRRCRKLSTESPQRLQHFISARLTLHPEGTLPLYEVDPVPLFKTKFAHQIRRQTDGKRITPFRNLHFNLQNTMIYSRKSISIVVKKQVGVICHEGIANLFGMVLLDRRVG